VCCGERRDELVVFHLRFFFFSLYPFFFFFFRIVFVTSVPLFSTRRIFNTALRCHLQARKLTPAEQKDKHRRKLEEDTSTEATVALFRVKDLSNGQHQFKARTRHSELHYLLIFGRFVFIVAQLCKGKGALWLS